MLRREYDVQDWKGVEWMDESSCDSLIRVQIKRETNNILVCLGFPQIGTATEAEAVQLVDEFAPTVAVLFADMRRRLEEIRHV